MGFFGGPSNQYLSQSALGVASFIMQIKLSSYMNENEKRELLENNDSHPRDWPELLKMTAEFMMQEDLGWYSRGKFLTMIYGSLLSTGLPQQEAYSIREELRVYYNSYCTNLKRLGKH